MVLVTHPSHRLAKRKHVEARDLAGEKFVAFDRDLAVRKAIDRALKQHGVKVEVVMEFDNVETIKQAIGIAAGVSILPRPTVVMESGMRTLATVPLALSGLARPIGLIYRRGKRLTPAVARFIETLRKADESRRRSRGRIAAVRRAWSGRREAGCPRPLKPPRLARHLARTLPPAPPSPRGGGCARRPASQGRLARRKRPALRGALRLVGFAPEGTLPPGARSSGARPSTPSLPRSAASRPGAAWYRMGMAEQDRWRCGSS